MPARSESLNAQASAELRGDRLDVELAGVWQVMAERPSWSEVLAGRRPTTVGLRADRVEQWDSSLLLFLFEVQQWCQAAGAGCETDALPARIQRLLGQLASSHQTGLPRDRSENFLTTVGNATHDTIDKARDMSRFLGDCTLALGHTVRRPGKFRWRDCLHEMQQCGAMALPIVSLISFLVGVTLAYTAAIVLRQFGGDIWIADLIGLSMVREMGAVMTSVVLAGRTGAAYAATLGNMKANEEIDALETLGISAVQFLVLPRMVALAVMMPLLTLYSNALGIVGGMVVAAGLLAIPPTAYWVEMQTIVDLSDIAVGVIKGAAFGLIVGLAGCLRGLQAERSAAGVGLAATSAVVTSILIIIIADAIFAVLFNVLGW